MGGGAASSGREEEPRVGQRNGLPGRMVKAPRMRAWISEWVEAELGKAFKRGYRSAVGSELRTSEGVG